MSISPGIEINLHQNDHCSVGEDEVITLQLEALFTPDITAQENYYCKLGLRDRIANLLLMVAALLTLLRQDVAGVNQLTRMLAKEGFLWCQPQVITRILKV